VPETKLFPLVVRILQAELAKLCPRKAEAQVLLVVLVQEVELLPPVVRVLQAEPALLVAKSLLEVQEQVVWTLWVDLQMLLCQGLCPRKAEAQIPLEAQVLQAEVQVLSEALVLEAKAEAELFPPAVRILQAAHLREVKLVVA